MAEAPLERRLAAVLAADVAGYSRLMGADEEGTLRKLKAHRKELIDPKITEHRGYIVKTTGDGMLVEFISVVDAVRCAIDIQRVMVERNAEVPAEKRIEFRIGINVGDIISDEDDIFGDGVNIAARIETLATPGGLCLSDSAYQPIKRKVAVDVSDMGEFQLKNIVQAVRVYSVHIDAPLSAPPTKLSTPPTDHLNPAETPHHMRSFVANFIGVILLGAGATLALMYIPYLSNSHSPGPPPSPAPKIITPSPAPPPRPPDLVVPDKITTQIITPSPAPPPRPPDLVEPNKITTQKITPPEPPSTPEAKGPPFQTSFDCGKASIWSEKQVCATMLLAAYDIQLARVYQRKLEALSGAERDALIKSQHAWIGERNTCENLSDGPKCLLDVYVDRLNALLMPAPEGPPSSDLVKLPETGPDGPPPIILDPSFVKVQESMDACDTQAAKNSKAGYLLVVPLAPSNADIWAPTGIGIAGRTVLLSSKDIMAGIKNNTMNLYTRPMTAWVYQVSTNKEKMASISGITQLTLDPSSSDSFRISFQTTNSARKREVSNWLPAPEPGKCYWLGALMMQ